MNYRLHYTSADGPERNASWSVYREEYPTFESEEPIDGLTEKISTHPSEILADREASFLQRILPVRDKLVEHRDAALALRERDDDGSDYDFEGETNEEVRDAVLDLYHDVARSLGILDEESSASSQHYIETGARLLLGEAITS